MHALPTPLIHGLDILEAIPSAEIQALLEGSEIIELSKNQILYEQGSEANSFAFVLSGSLKLCRTLGDKTSLLTLINQGGPVGYLLMNKPDATYPADVIALEQTKVLMITKEIYKKSWLKNSLITQRLLIAVQERCMGFHNLRSQQHAKLKPRLAAFLYDLYFLNKDTAGNKLTKKEIGQAIGAETATVIRAMKSFENQKLIEVSDSGCKILQPAELLKISQDSENDDL